MLISRWILSFTGQQRMLDDLINRITARCEPIVWSRVYPVVATMDPAQARGYIRARSARVIGRELQFTTSGMPNVSVSMRDQVRRGVTEKLVRSTLSEVSLHRPPRLAELRAA